MVPFVRACADARYSTVVGVFPTQIGKTDGVLNVVGHRLDDDPVPVLFIGPTRNNVERQIEPRFTAMVNSCDSLRRKYHNGKHQTKTHKQIAGTTFRIAWAGSATELASDPAGLAIVDERDRIEDIPGEGDVVGMARARTPTFADGRVVVISSPTLGTVTTYIDDHGLERWAIADADDLQSPIWAEWQEGTRHEYAWPCPDCKAYFIPRMKLLSWPEGATPQEAFEEARLACPNCGSLIEHKHKDWMLQNGDVVAPGEWIDRRGRKHGEPAENRTYSEWASGLTSTWRSWGEMAHDWLKAARSKHPGKIQVVLNTQFCELYSLAGEAMDWEVVAAKRRDYRFDQVPDFVQRILMTVDVQKDRLIYTIRGWGYKLESGLIRHGEIMGETEHDAVWEELAEFRDLRFEGKLVDACFIDSGYRPGDPHRRPDNQIYAFARQHRGWAYVIKGQQSQDKPAKPTRIDITLGGKTLKRGLQLWHLDTDFFKSWVISRIQWQDGEPGDWHLPLDADDDYCRQVTAETRMVKASGRVVWVRLRKANHYFDCEYMQAAGAHILGFWKLRKPELEEEPEPEEAAPESPTRLAEQNRSKAPRKKARRQRRNWVNRY